METATWLDSTFTVYDTGATWNDVAGVYIFASLRRDQHGNQRWYAYYIGQTQSFRDRIPNHEEWPEAARLGATHIHARVETSEDTRLDLERRLIQANQPPLNEQHR